MSGVELHSGDVFVCEPDWSWKVRNLPDLDLWCVMEGVGWISDGDRRTPIGIGDIVLLRRGASYEAGHDSRRPLKFVALHFDLVDRNGKRVDPPPEELPPFVRQAEASGFFRELMMRIVRCRQDGYVEQAHAWLQTAWIEILRQGIQWRLPGPLGEQARHIEHICERIRRSPGLAVKVDDLAAELHVSPEHFCRIFRRLQGMPPRAFLTRTRIEAAQSLLLTSNHSITRIAELLGYDSPFYFSRQFKSKVGFSPTDFRKGIHRTSASRGSVKKNQHTMNPHHSGRL